MTNNEQKNKLAKENLERLIAFELMQFTKQTGEVIDSIYINVSKDQYSSELYYDVDMECLWVLYFALHQLVT